MQYSLISDVYGNDFYAKQQNKNQYNTPKPNKYTKQMYAGVNDTASLTANTQLQQEAIKSQEAETQAKKDKIIAQTTNAGSNIREDTIRKMQGQSGGNINNLYHSFYNKLNTKKINGGTNFNDNYILLGLLLLFIVDCFYNLE
jgi:hypothetical protein